MPQNTKYVLMVKPVSFTFNTETSGTNAFQRSDQTTLSSQNLALAEFNELVQLLKYNGVQVTVVDDTEQPFTPDSIFPNNWFSTHDDGTMVVYPLFAPNRRAERRADIAQMISDGFVMNDILDLTPAENEGKFLEGTGSMVLDRDLRICYACISPRTNKSLLHDFCNKMGYELISFTALDTNKNAIYHTNVVMSVGDHFMVVCFDCVPNEEERHIIKQSTSKEVIEITLQQLNNFAGNMLELLNDKGEHLLVMSSRAYGCLTPQQITSMEKHARIIHSPLTTIENLGGGSARCMIAEIFLNKKKEE
jgi:hypothetical protein